MSMWNQKTQRNYSLQLSIYTGTQVAPSLDEFKNHHREVTIDYPITMEFEIVRNFCATLNSCDLKIYNLSPTTRDALFLDDRYNLQNYNGIILRAGYDPDTKNLPVVFSGNIWYIYSERKGANIITTIHAIDAGWDVTSTFTSFNIAPGVTDKAIFNILMKSFQYTKPGVVGNSFDNTTQENSVLFGRTYDLLQNKSQNKAFIDLETVHILDNNEALEGEVPLISSETGLLGTPRRENTFLSIDTIFEPRIKVAQLLEVKSGVATQWNGQFKVCGLTHRGVISGSECGDAITTFNLLAPNQLNNKGGNNTGGFNTIPDNKNQTNVNSPIGRSIYDVHQYLVDYGHPPDWKITSGISWKQVLADYSSQGSVPSLQVLNNLASISQKTQSFMDSYQLGNITIYSGWRSAAYNSTIEGSGVNSSHTQGQALDCSFSNYSIPQAWQIFNTNWPYKLEKNYWNPPHIHVDDSLGKEPNRF